MFINNKLWELNRFTSYCVHQTNKDFLIYRIGGRDNKTIPNVEYSIINDNYNKLPFTQTNRCHNSTVYNDNFGLITIGGYQFTCLSSVEISNNKEKKEWKCQLTLVFIPKQV